MMHQALHGVLPVMKHLQLSPSFWKADHVSSKRSNPFPPSSLFSSKGFIYDESFNDNHPQIINDYDLGEMTNISSNVMA